eukprot:g2900.t1
MNGCRAAVVDEMAFWSLRPQTGNEACKAAHPLLPRSDSLVAPREIKLAVFAIAFADTPRELLPTHEQMRQFYFGGVAGQLLTKWSLGCLKVEADFFPANATAAERDGQGYCIAEQGISGLNLQIEFASTGDMDVGTINGQSVDNFYGLFTSDHAWQLHPPYAHNGGYPIESNCYHNNAFRCLDGQFDLFQCPTMEYGDKYD